MGENKQLEQTQKSSTTSSNNYEMMETQANQDWSNTNDLAGLQAESTKILNMYGTSTLKRKKKKASHALESTQEGGGATARDECEQ